MKYRKKPVVVEAVKWDGGNKEEIRKFFSNGDAGDYFYSPSGHLRIHTQEGVMTAKVGDWIIKEPFPTNDRKFYPCKPDIFEQTYEPVIDESTVYGNDCKGGCEV